MPRKKKIKKNNDISSGKMNALGKAILVGLKEKINIPEIDTCLSGFETLLMESEYSYSKEEVWSQSKNNLKTKKSEIIRLKLEKLVVGDTISKELKEKISAHSQAISSMLLYAAYFNHFSQEANLDLDKSKEYQRKYLKAKKVLRKALGENKPERDEAFSDLMGGLIQSASEAESAYLGLLFHADFKGDEITQDLNDIFNAVKLTELSKNGQLPKQIELCAEMFGEGVLYKVIPLIGGLGHVLLPADLTKSKTVYVVCSTPDPAKMLENLKEGNLDVFTQVQTMLSSFKSIHAAELENWKPEIKVLGDEQGKKIVNTVVKGIKTGLKKSLAGTRVGKLGSFVCASAGGAKEIMEVESLTEVIVSLKENPKVSKRLAEAAIVAGIAVDISGKIGLTAKIRSWDKNLMERNATYRWARPAMLFAAKSIVGIGVSAEIGASYGSVIPGVGTAAGALIGAGIGLGMVIYKGYALWKKRKEEVLKKELQKDEIFGLVSDTYLEIYKLSENKKKEKPMRFFMPKEKEAESKPEESKPKEKKKSSNKNKPQPGSGSGSGSKK